MEQWFSGTSLGRMAWFDLVPLLGLPIFWVTAFLIYLIRCAIFGMERTPRIDEVTKTPWLPRVVMEFGYWMFRIPVRMCIALGITPNMITFGSLVLTVGAAVALSQGYFGLGGWTLLFAFTCDSWDGIVARATNTMSVSGEFFDSTIDRYNDLITFFGFMYYYRNDTVPLCIVLLAMIGSTIVSYARAKGKASGVDPNVGYMQRHERAVWIGVLTVLAPILASFIEVNAAHPQFHLTIVALAIVAVMSNITAIWRIHFVMVELRRMSPPPAPASATTPAQAEVAPTARRRPLASPASAPSQAG